MLPDRVSDLGPLTYESGALPIALRGPAGGGGGGGGTLIVSNKNCPQICMSLLAALLLSSLHFHLHKFNSPTKIR